MVITGLKNFWKNIKYIFVPLGTLFLSIIIALSVALPMLSDALDNMIGTVHGTIVNAQISIAELRRLFLDELSRLPGDPMDAIVHVLTTDWISETLNKVLASVDASVAQEEQLIVGAVNHFTDAALGAVAILFMCSVIGIIVGYWLVKSFIRSNIARRALRHVILAYIIDTLLIIVFSAVSARIYLLWRPGGIIAAIFTVILFGVVSLLEAYFLRGAGKIKFREVITFKNVWFLFLSNVVVLLCAAALSAVVYLIFGGLVTLFVALPLIAIAVIVNGMTAESYVIGKVEELQGGQEK